MSNLDTFAKVRALHDRTTNPGEKAAAASRMKVLARKAGMTVAEALSKLDAPKPRTQAAAAAAAFNDFFNSPEMRAARAERERENAKRRAAALATYGSEDAVFADTGIEAALRAACEPLLIWDTRPDWQGCYTLGGWSDHGGKGSMPAEVREAVTTGWPMPETSQRHGPSTRAPKRSRMPATPSATATRPTDGSRRAATSWKTCWTLIRPGR